MRLARSTTVPMASAAKCWHRCACPFRCSVLTLAMLKRVRWGDLENHKLVMLTRDSSVRTLIDRTSMAPALRPASHFTKSHR